MERKSNKKAEGKEKKSLTKKNAAVPEEPKAETSESSSSTTEETAAAVPAVIPAETKQEETQNVAEETKPAENAPTEAEKTETPAPQRPTMPDGFCMDQEEWESSNVCHDPENNACQACEKDAPECFATCKARGEFLFGAAKDKKARKSGGARAPRTNTSGKKPQSVKIDDMIREKMSIAAMVDRLAEEDFGGANEVGKKAANTRIQSHLKAIRTGTYCRAAEMLPNVSYLDVKPTPATQETSAAA